MPKYFGPGKPPPTHSNQEILFSVDFIYTRLTNEVIFIFESRSEINFTLSLLLVGPFAYIKCIQVIKLNKNANDALREVSDIP
jgi:hypothetical protein